MPQRCYRCAPPTELIPLGVVVVVVWRIRVSIPVPQRCERCALPIELLPLGVLLHAYGLWELNPGPSACEADVMTN